MKLVDLFEESKPAGYWRRETNQGVNWWVPIFEQPPKDALFPFVLAQNQLQGHKGIKHIQAFNILPGRKRQDLSQQEKILFGDLEDALKQRSHEDVIAEEHLIDLQEKCADILLGKTNLRNQKPERIFLITPPSGSDTADNLARILQGRLNVPDNQMFLGHFEKRDVLDVISDIEVNVGIEPESKQAILDRIYRSYANRADTTFKLKYLWQGHRNELRKAGISFLDLVAAFPPTLSSIPYLVVVDDNFQSGSTTRAVAQEFNRHTGIEPINTLGLTTFKYP